MNDRPTLLEKIDEALTIFMWCLAGFVLASLLIYGTTHLSDLQQILTFDRLVTPLETK